MASYFKRKQTDDIIKDVSRAIDIAIGKKRLIFSSLPRPSNVIEWVVGEGFLTPQDISLYDNRGQYYCLREYYQCYCPVCAEFSSRDVFNVDKATLLRDHLLVYDYDRGVEYCPKCNLTKAEYIAEGMLKDQNTLLGVVGMRAGKTTLAAFGMTFAEALFTGYENVRAFFGVSSAPFLEIGCIAVSAEQAKDTIWAQYRTLRDGSKWFQTLKAIVRDEGFIQDGLYDEQDTMIKNDITGLRIQSLSSSSASLVGRTRIMFVIDELGRFDTTDSKRAAKEVWRAGEGSLKTIRKTVSDRGLPPWMGSMFAIGSPISVDDYSMKMLHAEGTKNIFKIKMSTWQFNTTFKESDFEDDFKRDPVAAERDFGAEPPGAELPFLEDWALTVDMLEDKGLTPMATFTDTNRQEGNITYVGKALMEIRMDQSEWFLAGDAGRSKDTFALVGCRRVWKGSTSSMFQGFGLHILPNKKKRRYVDYTVIVPLIERMCEKWKVVKIAFDYWNSESIFQELQNKGFPVEQYAMSSLRVEDFFNFKTAMMAGKIKVLPRKYSEDGESDNMDSQTRMYWEMKRMQRSKDLKKVDHSSNSTSDLFECLVNCWRMTSSTSFSQTDSNSNMMGTVVQFPRSGFGGGRGW